MSDIPDHDAERRRFEHWEASNQQNNPWTCWLAGQGLELAQCSNCRKPFLRRRGSRKKTMCNAKRCRAITKIKNSVATFDGIPNDPSECRADLDYHGKIND